MRPRKPTWIRSIERMCVKAEINTKLYVKYVKVTPSVVWTNSKICNAVVRFSMIKQNSILNNYQCSIRDHITLGFFFYFFFFGLLTFKIFSQCKITCAHLSGLRIFQILVTILVLLKIIFVN